MNDVTVYEGQRSALMSASDILTQVKTVQEVMQAVMKKDVHYGIVPGTKKPSLWKPGAEILCAVFHVADTYVIEDLSTEDCIRYRVTCGGTHQASGTRMGEGIGECSSNETKYKWVRCYGKKEFEHTPENRRRITYGKSKDGGGEYEMMQVRAETADVANTILKMAAKRAKVAMTLNVTAASDIFSQDLEDLDERLREAVADDETVPDKPVVPQPKAKSGNGNAAPPQQPEATQTNGSNGAIAPAGMLKIIRAKAAAIGVEEARLLECHKLTTLDGITVDAGNNILKSLASGAEAYAA